MWEALERYWKPLRQKGEGAGRKSGTLHLTQAQSNRGPRGRKEEQKLREEFGRRIVLAMYVEGDGDSVFEDTVFALDAIQGLGGKVVLDYGNDARGLECGTPPILNRQKGASAEDGRAAAWGTIYRATTGKI